MSWLRRGGRSSAGEGDERSAPGDLTFEYLPLPPTALLRVSADWPDADRSAPDVLLVVHAGDERHELEPLPDPAAAERSGWRAAFAAPFEVVETEGALFALRIGGEDLPLGAPLRRAELGGAEEGEDFDERLASIAA